LENIREAAFAPVFASFRAILGGELAAISLATAEQEQAALLERMRADPNTRIAVAESNGAPIGFVCIVLHREQALGEIALLFVTPASAGRGVGAALCNSALDVMRTENLRAAYVAAGADESHAPALRTYAKAGFAAGIPSTHLYRML
jgi:GNAT superfamily N-acetyltransferase